MYQALVTVFSGYERCFMLKRCLVAWGVPAVIVAVTAAVDVGSYSRDRQQEDQQQVCYLSTSQPVTYYTSLVTPACVIVLVNCVIFITVSRVLLKPRFQQQTAGKGVMSVTPAQVRGAVTVMFLMGVPWIFGPLALREAKVVFSYLFCICNSLQVSHLVINL